MTEKGEKILIAVAACFLVVSLVVMGYIMIFHKGESENRVASTESEERIEAEYFVAMDGKEWDIVIPTPYQEANDLFRVEENLKDRTIEIVMSGLEEDYYYDHQVQGNEEKISQVRYQQDEDETRLRFVLKDIYVTETRQMGGEICLRLENPTDSYEHLLVVDGFSDDSKFDDLEKQKVKCLLNGNVTVANDVRADYFISLSVEATSEQNQITIYYNDDFFIPDFDSKSLAELLEAGLAQIYGSDCVKSVKTDNHGLAEAMLPAVKIVGKVNVPPETDMRERLASFGNGIENVVITVMTEQYQETEE